MPKVAAGDTGAPANNNQSGPRSRKGAETRARLIEAAREVFERDGFLTARISDIAAAAGLSQGSFYHYFDSKEQVFREVAEAQEQRLTAPLDDAAAAPREESPRAVIRRANRRYLEHYRDAAQLMGVIEQVSRYDEEVSRARIATQQHFAERAERSIRRMQRSGIADKKVDAAMAADALGAMVARFAEMWLVQGYREYDFDKAVDQLTMLWANALGIEDEPARPAARVRKRTK